MMDTLLGSELVAAALHLGTQSRVLSRTRLFDVWGYEAASPHVVLQNVPELARRMAPGAAVAR
jgi:hypothetical protein